MRHLYESSIHDTSQDLPCISVLNMNSLCFQSAAEESNTKHNGEEIDILHDFYYSNTDGYFGRQPSYNSNTHSNSNINQSP